MTIKVNETKEHAGVSDEIETHSDVEALPWRIDNTRNFDPAQHVFCGKDLVATAPYTAYAELIVTAVNSHASLRIALECAETQLSLVAQMLADANLSTAWNDVADACAKQARVARTTLVATNSGTETK